MRFPTLSALVHPGTNMQEQYSHPPLAQEVATADTTPEHAWQRRAPARVPEKINHTSRNMPDRQHPCTLQNRELRGFPVQHISLDTRPTLSIAA